MENYEESIKIDYNPNWLYIPDHHYRTLIIGGSGSGKTVLLNLMKYQRPDTDKINMLQIQWNQSINRFLI